jgi:hypothetical protein
MNLQVSFGFRSKIDWSPRSGSKIQVQVLDGSESVRDIYGSRTQLVRHITIGLSSV